MDKLTQVSGTIKSTKKEETNYKVQKDGITRCIKVCKVENGYIVEISEYGEKEDKDKGKYWYDESQTFVSKTNPMDSKNSKTPDVTTVIKGALENLKL